MSIIDDYLNKALPAGTPTLISNESQLSGAQSLNDAIPALLLPYRMETRFHQKEYTLVYVTEHIPPVIGRPIGIGTGGLFDEDSFIPIKDTPQVMLELVTDIKNINANMNIDSGDPVKALESLTGAEGISNTIENLTKTIGDYIVSVNPAAQSTYEFAASRVVSTIQQTSEVANALVSEIGVLREDLIKAFENLKALIIDLIDLAGETEFGYAVAQEGNAITLNLFQANLEDIALQLAAISNPELGSAAYLASVIQINKRIRTSTSTAVFLSELSPEEIEQIRDAVEAISDQITGLETVTNEVDLALGQQQENYQQISEQVGPVIKQADDQLILVSTLPVVPDGVKIPSVLITHTRTEIRWELLVRIYPDEISVDTHEPQLTDEEYRDGKLFWTKFWVEPLDEEEAQLEWHKLAEAYGRFRAAWIVKATRPLNIEIDLSLFDIPETIASGVSPIGTPEIEAGRVFWNQVWDNYGSQEAYDQAWEEINAVYPSPVSNIIVYATTPNNINERALQATIGSAIFNNGLLSQYLPPQYPDEIDIEKRVNDTFTWQKVPNTGNDPDFPPQDRREGTWTRAPYTKVLPDRFTVITQHTTEGRNQYTGNDIPSEPLAVGFDPNFQGYDVDEEPTAFNFEGEEISPEEVDNDPNTIDETVPQTDPGIEWMVNFEAAEEIGMGIRINLGTEKPEGFEKVFVLGLKQESPNPAETGKTLVEELFNSHHYTGDGLSILSQGIPTNNTEKDNAGFNQADDGHINSYNTELRGPIYTPKSDNTNKSDGQWMAEMLGLEYSTTYNLDNGNNFDIANAIAMNQAMAPATILPFAEQMLGNIFLPKDNPQDTTEKLDDLRTYFTKYVVGRGHIPPIRVGKQPYGILGTTAWSRWQTESNDPQYISSIKPILDTFGELWQEMHQKYVQQIDQAIEVTGIDPNTDPTAYADKELELGQARFMNIMGLNPGAVEWYQQMGIGEGPLGSGLLNLLANAGASNPDISDKELLSKEFGLDPNTLTNNMITHLQWINHNYKLKGAVVETGDLSEKEVLKSILADRNYINLLLDSSLPAIRSEDYYKSLAPGVSNFKYPNSLLYLYLRYGLLNQYFDTGMRLLNTVAQDADDLYGTKLRKTVNVFQPNTSGSSTQTQWDYLLKQVNSYPLKGGYNFSNYSYLADYLIKTYNTTDFQDEKKELLEVRRALEMLSQTPTAKLHRDFLEHIDLCTYRFDAWQSGLVNHRLEKQRTANRAGVYLGGFSWVENLSPDNSLERIPENELPSEHLVPEDQELYKDPKNQGFILAPSQNHGVAAAMLRNAYVSHYEGDTNSQVAVNLSSERIRLVRQVIDGVRNGQGLAAILGYRFERYLHDISKSTGANLEKYILDVRKGHPLAETVTLGQGETPDQVNEAVSPNNVVNGLALHELARNGGTDYQTWLDQFNDGGTDDRPHIEKIIDHLANIVDAISDVAMSEAVFHTVNGNTERAKAFLDAVSKNGMMPIPEAFETPRTGDTQTHTLGVLFPPIHESDIDLSSSIEGRSRTPRSIAEPSLDGWLGDVLPDRANIRIVATYDDGQDEVWSASDLALYPIDLMQWVKKGLKNDDSGIANYIRHNIRCKKGFEMDATVDLNFHATGTTNDASILSFGELAITLEKIRSVIGVGNEMTNEHFIHQNGQLDNDPNNTFFVNNKKGYYINYLQDRVQRLISGDVFNVATFDPGAGSGLGGITLGSCDIPFAGLEVILDKIQDLAYGQMYSDPAQAKALAQSIRSYLFVIWKYGFEIGLPAETVNGAQNQQVQYVEHAFMVLKQIRPLVEEAKVLVNSVDPTLPEEAYTKLMKAADLLTGNTKFRLFPIFKIENQAEMDNAIASTMVYDPENPNTPQDHSSDSLELIMRDWLGELARMRTPVATMDDMLVYLENISENAPAFTLKPYQYPVSDDNYWTGMEYPDDHTPEKGAKSLVFFGDTSQNSQDWCGLVMDEWNETIPSKSENIAATFHYDQPNAKAPNCLLLAVSPQITGQWNWDDLVQTLDDTLEMAKKRAVEPEHMDNLQKNGEERFPKIFPTTVAPLLENDRGFTVDLGDNNDQRLYTRPTYQEVDIAVGVSVSLIDENRDNSGVEDEGYAINFGPSEF